jgi:histidinol-phosphate aminotransferase
VNDAGMVQITAGLDRLGFGVIPSFGNFVCVQVGNGAETYRRLLKKGVIVRPVANYEMPEFLRVSIGLESENARFLSVLEEVMSET